MVHLYYGLLSRYKLDDYIDHKISAKKLFGLIMIDLDEFKNINYEYGHISGDRALKLFSNALTSVASLDMILGRYAGDEFVVITKVISDGELKEYVVKLEKRLLELEKEDEIKYSVKFSIGYSEWNREKNYDYETLINIVDNNMYHDKNSKKLVKIELIYSTYNI